MGDYTVNDFPVSGTANFESNARTVFGQYKTAINGIDNEIVDARNGESDLKDNIDSKADSDHTHGAGGTVLSIVASYAALGTGVTDGELKTTADTGLIYSWDQGGSIWRETSEDPLADILLFSGM